jgi:hypothetical protein
MGLLKRCHEVTEGSFKFIYGTSEEMSRSDRGVN